MDMPAGSGWRISNVERLTGLSRRDIQRACYEGPGGVGVLKPQDSSWGRRTYSVQDLATLFLLAEGRRHGQTLSQAARQLRSDQETASIDDLLQDEIERLQEQLAEIADRLLRAEGLFAATGDEPQRSERLRAWQAWGKEVEADMPCNPAGAADGLPGLELLDEFIARAEQASQEQPHEGISDTTR